MTPLTFQLISFCFYKLLNARLHAGLDPRPIFDNTETMKKEFPPKAPLTAMVQMMICPRFRRSTHANASPEGSKSNPFFFN